MNWRLKRTNAVKRLKEALAKRHTCLNKKRQLEFIRWQIATIRKCDEKLCRRPSNLAELRKRLSECADKMKAYYDDPANELIP